MAVVQQAQVKCQVAGSRQYASMAGGMLLECPGELVGCLAQQDVYNCPNQQFKKSDNKRGRTEGVRSSVESVVLRSVVRHGARRERKPHMLNR